MITGHPSDPKLPLVSLLPSRTWLPRQAPIPARQAQLGNVTVGRSVIPGQLGGLGADTALMAPERQRGAECSGTAGGSI